MAKVTETKPRRYELKSPGSSSKQDIHPYAESCQALVPGKVSVINLGASNNHFS